MMRTDTAHRPSIWNPCVSTQDFPFPASSRRKPPFDGYCPLPPVFAPCGWIVPNRSEEHTSELQSLMRISYAVFCLKKKNKKTPKRNACIQRTQKYTKYP